MNRTTRNLMIGFGAVTGLLLVGAVIASGYMQRSVWSILLLSGVFTILYIYGKRPAWKKLAADKPAMVIPSFLGTYVMQTVMCGVFYLIGFGAKSMLDETGARAPLGTFDYQFAGGLLIVGLVLGTIINQLTKRVFADLSSLIGETRAQLDDAEATLSKYTGAGPARKTADICLSGKTVTPESLIVFRDHSHASGDADPDMPGVDNSLSEGGDDKIAETETRLGRELPASLKAIYRIRNGGSINNVCIPNGGKEGPELNYDDVIKPFSGYNDLVPMERLDSAWEWFTHFGDPEDKDNYGQFFRSGTENMIALAMWYCETLFLDYNQPGQPRVGFVDFDREDWESHTVWWPNFEAFFAALRHYKDL